MKREKIQEDAAGDGKLEGEMMMMMLKTSAGIAMK